jgi:hypothetical protein
MLHKVVTLVYASFPGIVLAESFKIQHKKI